MRKNPRLLIVIGSLMVGGTETFLVRLLSNLAQQGWDIEIFTLSYHPGVLASDLQKKGVRVTSILNEKDQNRLSGYPKLIERGNRIFLCLFRLIFKLRKEKNAILHLFLPEAYVLGMIAAQLARFPGPKIMSRRSLNYYQRKRPVVAWLEKYLHQYTSVVIGNSTRVIEQLHQEGIAKDKLKLIYNGLDTGHYQAQDISTLNELKKDMRETLGISEETLVFIIVANLIPYKGHSDLLKAFKNIKDKIPEPWKLICVGRDQGILESLKQLARDCQIDKNILWLGERKDVPKLLQSADVGILCSHEEGFSNAVLEAMAFGLPIVVTDVGGNAEAVLHNTVGYVVPPKDPKALGDALLKLALNKDQMKLFGKNAKQRVKEHFTLEKCVFEHVEVYRQS